MCWSARQTPPTPDPDFGSWITRTRTYAHPFAEPASTTRLDSCSHAQRCVKCGHGHDFLQTNPFCQIFGGLMKMAAALCLGSITTLGSYTRCIILTRGFPCLEHTRSPSGPQPTRPCRSDVFVSHQASLSRSPSFQRKGFRSQVKQMSGDDRIRARQARNFFARPDTSRATDTADMTRARRRQRSPRSWHCGSN